MTKLPKKLATRLLAAYFGFIASVMLFPAAVWANGTGAVTPDTEVLKVSDYLQQIEQAETRLKNNITHSKILQDISKNMLVINNYAPKCIAENEAKLAKVAASLESLSTTTPADETDTTQEGEAKPETVETPLEASGNTPADDVVAVTRQGLEEQKQAIDKTLAQCRLIQLRTKDLLEQAQQIEKALLNERLLAQTPGLMGHTQDILSQPRSLKQEVTYIVETLGNLPIDTGNLYRALIYGLFGALVGLFWSLYAHKDHENPAPALAKTSPALASTWHSIIHTSPGLLLFGLTNLSLLFYPVNLQAINDLALALLILTVSYTILNAMLTPQQSVKGFDPLTPHTRRKLIYWARLLLAVMLLSTLFQSAVFNTEPSSHLIGLLRITLGTLLGVTLARLMWLLRRHLPTIRKLRLHWLSIAIILIIIGMMWLGYNNFSLFLFQSLLGTLFTLLLGWLFVRIPIEIFDSMDKGAAGWQKSLRRNMALDDSQLIPGLIWLRLLHILVVGGVIIIVLLRLWGTSEQSFNLLAANISNGYTIGEFTLKPLSVLGGLLILSFGILLVQPVKRSLSQHWLEKTNLSQGAKEAAVTIIGYAGVALAMFVGLSMAGVDFSNLAIVAGALSVGIGFGLQNIVNNFMSGLILLFERPIRRGDWIRAGAAEGYVKDISIRSTVIHTFDRADIIVPNSELISNQVTNMMLSDQFGRIIIPVRVAYGADTDEVIDTLRGVAEIYPGVLREKGKLQIQTLLKSFGETAMNFELRVHLRDVETMMTATSELNLAIARAFRKAGIEMPLPSQVVMLKQESLPEQTSLPDD